MAMDNIKELVLEDATFEGARQNFNRVLQRLFRNMLDSGSSEGSITLKVDVSLQREYIPNNDPDIEGETREIQKPKFDHKVSSTITVKDELKGNNNPEMELIWDEEKQMYVLAYIANTGQRSIFDKDQPWNQQQNGQEEGTIETDPEKKWMNVKQIGGPVADEHALPGEVSDPDVIDGEFRDVQEDGEAENEAENQEDGENTGEEPETSPDGDNDGESEDDGYSYQEPDGEE